MPRRTLAGAATGMCLILALAACSTGAGDTASTADESPGSTTSGNVILDREVNDTEGPNGEAATPVADLTFTDDEVAELRAGDYKAAMLWHTSSAFVAAVQAGAQAEFERLGIDVIATADAKFDAGTQADQVQTTMVRKPDVILSLPVDPTTAATAFRAAVDNGTELIFLSNVPEGFTRGEHYTSIVTDDLVEMGRQAAVALGDALGGTGEVGIMYYEAEYYVTNQRDAAFKQTLLAEFPDIEIVAEQGFTDPNTAESIASAMLTQNPGLDGLYTSWAEPAQGALAALRTAGNTTTKIVTLDLDDTVAVDMLGGGQTLAIVADEAWNLGKGMAAAAGYALLGKEAPAFAITGVLTVTKENVEQGYRDSLNSDLPPAVADALSNCEECG
ncbi:substrate-binding domain-containing protein [Phytoactinopolyspora limicola]|uniref:substrate-binding domain-containing protein n=1 Tax=Phytoactinopolyspora limicola TaxID=2715536 RepID=UPI001A9C6310|nr:substrate-binding domain-containing protein [Phytoactinopolyspora limicola]